MRVKEPGGVYIVDPDDKRAMRRADPKKGERGEYALYGEGIDNDGDGFINEDGPGGVNINRNFMHEYPYYKPEAGRYMVSEAETKAMLAWLVKHRNVAAVLAFGENDNLITAPNAQGRYGSARTLDLTTFAEASIAGASKTGMFAAGGLAALFGRGGRGGGGGEMMISEDMLQALMASGGAAFMGGGQRGGTAAATAATTAGGRGGQPQRTPAVVVNPGDVEYFRLVSAKYAELTGIRTAPLLAKPEGRSSRSGTSTSACRPSRRPAGACPKRPAAGRPGMGAAGAPSAVDPRRSRRRPAERRPNAGLHGPTRRCCRRPCGPAERREPATRSRQPSTRPCCNGWTARRSTASSPGPRSSIPTWATSKSGASSPTPRSIPPAAKIAELGKSHAEFALYLTSLFPKMAVAKLEAVAQGGGLYRVKAEVENVGFWPTAMTHAVVARAVRPTMVQLQVAPESILSGHQKTNFVQSLTGSGGRQKFDWLIKGKAGDTLTLKVVSQKAGAAEAAVTLK